MPVTNIFMFVPNGKAVGNAKVAGNFLSQNRNSKWTKGIQSCGVGCCVWTGIPNGHSPKKEI